MNKECIIKRFISVRVKNDIMDIVVLVLNTLSIT
jgi:hypothetical protein